MATDDSTAQDRDTFLIAIADGSYGVSDEDWPKASEAFRRGLEAEFGVGFKEGNIGPGADLPAFITLLQTPTVPLWQLMAAAFFLGKPIKDNWETWRDMAQAVRAFFSRPAFLNRQSAAPIAVDAVAESVDGSPKSIRLLGYQIRTPLDATSAEDRVEGIANGPETLFLGFTRHVFEVEADGERFRVEIEGTSVSVVPLSPRDTGSSESSTL